MQLKMLRPKSDFTVILELSNSQIALQQIRSHLTSLIKPVSSLSTDV